MSGANAAALPGSLVLVGAGKMGLSLLKGWLEQGLDPFRTTLIDPHPSDDVAALRAAHGGQPLLRPDAAGVDPAEVVVLAVKPQMLEATAPGLDPLIGPETLLVSILAGKTIADLRRTLPRARAVVRAMPNLPASVGRGATGAVAGEGVGERQRAVAHALLAGVGLVEWVESESLVDAVTAVSGSGPAYVFHLTECLAAAGREAGLPADLAARLARATVIGAGELLARSDLPAATLRENVTSPGGTTAAALDVLGRESGLKCLMAEAVAAAKRRAGELSGGG